MILLLYTVDGIRWQSWWSHYSSRCDKRLRVAIGTSLIYHSHPFAFCKNVSHPRPCIPLRFLQKTRFIERIREEKHLGKLRLPSNFTEVRPGS
jgi:hypothetical protein